MLLNVYAADPVAFPFQLFDEVSADKPARTTHQCPFQIASATEWL
jgi:hypothetical protein